MSPLLTAHEEQTTILLSTCTYLPRCDIQDCNRRLCYHVSIITFVHLTFEFMDVLCLYYFRFKFIPDLNVLTWKLCFLYIYISGLCMCALLVPRFPSFLGFFLCYVSSFLLVAYPCTRGDLVWQGRSRKHRRSRSLYY